MKRTLYCLTAIALLGACKKDTETATPGDATADTGDKAGGDKPATTVAQEPDPPAIAEARKQYLAGQYTKVTDALRPLTEDLKTRQQLRASGLSAAWLAMALAEDVAENAKEPADHAQAMAEQTTDPEVRIAAKLAQGTYKLKTEDFAGAAADFEEAFNLQKDGPNAALALVMFGNTKINMAFGGEERDQITNPGELDSANSTFVKAQRQVAGQQGGEFINARAMEGLAAVARYKNNNAEACKQIGEAVKIYKANNAGQPLLDAANALQDAAKCQPSS